MARRLPLRQSNAELPSDDAPTEVGPDIREIPDPGGTNLEAIWEQEWKTNLFNAAMQKVKQRVKEEHYLIFDLYVLKGWPVLKVARKVGVNVGQVYLAKHRIEGLIRKEIEAMENEYV